MPVIGVIGMIAVGLFVAPRVHAVVILPAVVLIPLVKLVAVVVAALSVPVASTGVFIAKMTKDTRLAITVSVVALICVTIVAAVILRIIRPENPWF